MRRACAFAALALALAACGVKAPPRPPGAPDRAEPAEAPASPGAPTAPDAPPVGTDPSAAAAPAKDCAQP